MASTYSTSLKLELIGQGEQSGTWGLTTNNNFGALVEQAITGVQTITMANAQYTLSSYDGAVDEARNAVLVLSGTNSAPQNLVAPAVEKVYIVNNQSGNTVSIKTSSGNAIAITNGTTTQVYCDGTNFYSVAPSLNSVTGNFAATGSITAGTSLNSGTSVNAGTSVTGASGVFSGSVTASSFVGLGTIVQTKYSLYTSNYSVYYPGYFDTIPHSVTITPSSASSKILVMSCGGNNFNNFDGPTNQYLSICRNGNNLSGNSNKGLQNYFNGGYAVSGIPGNWANSMVVLDSPATTSTLTYQIYGNGNFNYGNNMATPLVAIEILQNA
jgi:hypothetical protein